MLRTFFVGLAAFLYSATAFGQVEFALAAAGQGDEPDIFDDEGWDGEYIRLTYDGQGNQSNGVTWPVVTPAEFGLLEFDFELRVWNEDFA